MEYKDYYAVLGVDRSADEKTIRRAYRKLARRFHPDVSTEAGADTRFREINEAYEVLKDADKRARYDRLGAQRRQAGPADAPWVGWTQASADPGIDAAGSGFSAFFDMLFGRGAAENPWAWNDGSNVAWSGAPGTDVEARIELSLEEAASGGVHSLSLRDPESGDQRTMKVRVPAGVRDGQRIRVSGQGKVGAAGGRTGDLYLVVAIRPHGSLRLDGDDLHATVRLSPAQAALGTTLRVPTLDGEVQVRIPQCSSSGRRVRLRGKGYPRADGSTGDLFVEIRVELPASLSPRERELYEQLEQCSQGTTAVA